jgi:SacI homology domain
MEIARGTTLLGYTATDTLAGILLATKVTTKATLPGGHSINLVTDGRWELLPLDSSSSATNNPTAAAEEQEFWRSMQQHTVGGVHYYCETADLTRPFPSSHPPTDPELEFIWNAWLSQPLRDLGLPTHCPQLLQGAVESVDEVQNLTGQRYTLCLLSRRSRKHPGTRYIARGLNEIAGPGNEIEAELLIWTPSAGGGGSNSKNKLSNSGAVKWARVAWRRGTVPIWWGVELQPLNKGLQAEVYVQEKGTYVGMLSYVRTLQRLSTADALPTARDGHGSTSGKMVKDKDDDTDDTGKVTFINLLHCNPKKAAELMLSTHFEEGMAHVKARLAAKHGTAGGPTGTHCAAPPSLRKFDWHGVMAMLNEEQGIEAFWTFIEYPVKNAGFAVGVMERRKIENSNDDNTNITDTNGENSSGDDISAWGEQWQMRWLQRQRGLLRFNCADSLDRTNAATCFAMLPVLQEGLRLLGIPLENTRANGVGGVGGGGVASVGEAGTLQSPLRAGIVDSSSRSSLHGGNQEDMHNFLDAGQEGEEKDEFVLPEGWERREHAGRAVYIYQSC